MTGKPGKDVENEILKASKFLDGLTQDSLGNEGAGNLSAAQFRILELISLGIEKPSDISSALRVSPPATSSVLERLENKGLLRREFSPTDRRCTVLILTEDGASIVRGVRRRRKRYLRKVFGEMDVEAVEQLERSLEEFNLTCGKIAEGGAAG